MSIPIRGASWGSAGAAFEVAKRRGAMRLDFLLPYLKALYADCATVGIRADLLVAQADLETAAYTSTYWTRDGNPAGLAAFDDGSNWGLTFTPEKAARAHVTHMLAYLGIEPPDGWKAADARWQAVIDAGYFGAVTTTDDLGDGRWATDPDYGAKIESRHAAYTFAPPLPAPSLPAEDTAMALPLKKMMVPLTNRNHPKALLNESGDLYIMVHETGNTGAGADAEMHARFVMNGGGSSSVAFHLTVDQVEAYQMYSLKYIGWHASDGCDSRALDWGCFRSVAIETCVNDGNRYKDATRRNLATLIYMILTGDPAIDFGGVDYRRFSVDRIRTHNDAAYDGKWCPTYMLNDRYIPVLRASVAAMVGGTTPAPAKDGIVVGGTIKSIDTLNVRGGPGVGYDIRYQLLAGEQAYVKDGPRVADGYTWYDVVHTTKGPGWAAADWMEVVASPPPPPPAPTYATPSIVSELAALGKDDRNTAAALVVKNGVDFFTVWDEVEAVRETPLLQFAFDGAKEVGPKAKPGDRRWVSHAFTADDGRGYYYDEHAARLVMADWTRTSD